MKHQIHPKNTRGASTSGPWSTASSSSDPTMAPDLAYFIAPLAAHTSSFLFERALPVIHPAGNAAVELVCQ